MHRCRLPHQADAGRRRRLNWRLIAQAAAAALLLRSPGTGAVSYLPGPEPDPPTGATETAEAPQPAGNGIEWRLAPLRYGGTVSLDGRWLRLDDGSRSAQALLFNDIEFATYVWQPWFIQLRAGLGTLASRDTSSGSGAASSTSTSAALTGRFAVAVFPASRFPFEFRAEVGDSRVRGDTLGTDYRSERISLSQSYRPQSGNDSYSLNAEHSRLRSNDGDEDTVATVRGTALRQFGDHTYELSGQLTVNDRSETDETSRVGTLTARHAFHPAGALHVDTLASWNELQLRSSGAGTAGAMDSSTDIRQLSSFATWRPREGEWLYSPDSPLYLTGSMRLIDAGTDAADAQQRLRALNASLGVSQELTREWRLSGSVSATQLEAGGGATSKSVTGNANATYTPQGLQIGEWRYTPTLSANAGATRGTLVGARYTLGGQAAHGVSRGIQLGESDNVTINLTQSLGLLRDSQAQVVSRSLAHSVGLFWQGVGDGASQSYASISASDSRSWADESGSFQLINLQLSRRTQLTRYANWSGNLTLQTSRSDTTQLDALAGVQRQASSGWQSFASGTLSYENHRFAGVPRLRYTALLSVNTQQLESRALGDIDAPRERITESLENRVDYSIGRLEARLSARLARFDGRNVASIFARVQRRY